MTKELLAPNEQEAGLKNGNTHFYLLHFIKVGRNKENESTYVHIESVHEHITQT
jgi:hypothetical protein